MIPMLKLLRKLWEYLREVSGDYDYQSYRNRALAHGERPQTPAEFYLSKQRHKYSRINRCC
jgi:hypothetical protein